MTENEYYQEILGEEFKKEKIEDQLIWDLRYWLEGLNTGEFSKVYCGLGCKEYTDADKCFGDILTNADRVIEIAIGKDNAIITYEDSKFLTLVNDNNIFLKNRTSNMERITAVEKYRYVIADNTKLSIASKCIEPDEVPM
jgi:hypothetical protein